MMANAIVSSSRAVTSPAARALSNQEASARSPRCGSRGSGQIREKGMPLSLSAIMQGTTSAMKADMRAKSTPS